MNYIIIEQSFRGRGMHFEITGEIAAGGHGRGTGLHQKAVGQSFRGRGKHCEITGEIAAGGHDSGMGLHHVLRGAFCGIDTRRCPAATCCTKNVPGRQATWPPRCAITVNTKLPENVAVIEVIDSCGSLAAIA